MKEIPLKSFWILTRFQCNNTKKLIIDGLALSVRLLLNDLPITDSLCDN